MFLLTYWKECDKERWDLATGEISVEAKVFKTNPNSRDLKGQSLHSFHARLDPGLPVTSTHAKHPPPPATLHPGWTCVCIAVFHDSRKVLKLLLEHGGDPNIRSTYNKNAWDLSKVRSMSVSKAPIILGDVCIYMSPAWVDLPCMDHP